MSVVEQSVEVEVPVRTAYDQWTQFKSFPRMMNPVLRVDQVGPAMTRWKVRVGPLPREYMAEIVEQRPDSLIAWRDAERHPRHWGEVYFRAAGPDRAVIEVQLHLEPRGLLDRLPGTANRVRQAVREALDNFNEGVYATATGKAMFTCDDWDMSTAPPGHLVLQSMRSHDQWNTIPYTDNDRYRGIHGRRNIIMVNPDDMAELSLTKG